MIVCTVEYFVQVMARCDAEQTAGNWLVTRIMKSVDTLMDHISIFFSFECCVPFLLVKVCVLIITVCLFIYLFLNTRGSD